MNAQDCEQLMLFQEASPVSRSLLPGSSEARMMTATSGLKCLESYKNSSPLGSLVRMCLASSRWHSTRCLLRWKTQVTKSNRLLFRLAVSMPRTKENDVPLWPTPSTGAALCGGTYNFKTLQKMAEKGLITEEERRNFSAGNGGKTNPQLLEWLMGYEQQFTNALIPTPRTSCANAAAMGRHWMPQREREREREYKSRLEELTELTPLGRIGRLNPNWTEWLMGYPIGWTDLDVLETQ